MSRKNLGDYATVLSRVRQALSSNVSLHQPFENERDFAKFKKTVDDGRRLLPSRYHQTYVDVLDEAIRQAEKTARRSGAAGRARVLAQLESVFNTLAQPVVQLADSVASDRLKAFQALTSNLYRRFMDDPKVRSEARKTLRWPELDPLAFFAMGQSDPFTLPASLELPVALIAKPSSHSSFVPLWMVDAHEVGGHVIHSAVNGFETEVETNVREAIKNGFQTGAIKTSVATVKMRTGSFLAVGRGRSVPIEAFMTQLFEKWLPELLADAAGVLNMGPMYANGGMLVLSAHNPEHRSANIADFESGKGADSHPADIIRALFAIEVVERLALSEAREYGQALRERAAIACGGTLHDNVVFRSSAGTIFTEVKLSDLSAILPIVADAVCNKPLKSLGDRTLSKFMTWGNKDEATTQKIAKLLPTGHDFEDVLEARHVVSAAVLAVEQASTTANFSAVCQRIHGNSLLILKSLYEEQCLLCAVPDYGETRRNDIRLADLARLVKGLRAR
ncbi:MAG: hypothetical protein SGJ27_27955 [Candidatus Melainabacteria bacterium]|nr:hypothetical protein [Candidatus Melainabacteria bacterium]